MDKYINKEKLAKYYIKKKITMNEFQLPWVYLFIQ